MGIPILETHLYIETCLRKFESTEHANEVSRSTRTAPCFQSLPSYGAIIWKTGYHFPTVLDTGGYCYTKAIGHQSVHVLDTKTSRITLFDKARNVILWGKNTQYVVGRPEILIFKSAFSVQSQYKVKLLTTLIQPSASAKWTNWVFFLAMIISQ